MSPKPLRGRLSVVLVALVVGVLGSGVASASASSVRPTQSTTVRLLRMPKPWLHEDEVFQMHVRVDGAPADAVLRLERYSPVTTRGAFDESDGDDLGDPEHDAVTPLAGLPIAADGGVDVAYPMADDVALTDFGVYPMRLSVEAADGSSLAELVTYLVLLPNAEATPLNVAVVMEVGAPTSLQPDGTTEISGEARAAINARIQVLQQTRQPVTVAPHPETLDGLAADDDGAALLNGLRGALAGRSPLARPYVDLDLEALIAAGLFTEEPPEAEAGAQAVRNRLHEEPIPGIWLSGATLGSAAIDALREMRVSNAVVPPSAVASVDGDEDVPTTSPVALAEGGPVAFIEDEALAARLVATDGALGAQRFLAELALLWMSDLDEERGVVVRVPEEEQIDPDLVTAAVEGMATGEAAKPLALRDLFQALTPTDGQDLPVAELSPHTDGPNLAPLVDPRGRASALVTGLAGTLDDKALVASLNRSLLISLGSDVPDERREAYVNRVFKVVADLARQVSAPEEFQITLTAREGTIPLTLTNETGRSIVVNVHLESNQLTFPGGTTFQETLAPGATRLDIDVRTRTSGAFPLDITVTSPNDAILLDQTTFTIRSTAVSGAGIVLSVGAGLFLLIWWARHWRTAQRSKRLVA
jgi:hypothetical protein